MNCTHVRALHCNKIGYVADSIVDKQYTQLMYAQLICAMVADEADDIHGTH